MWGDDVTWQNVLSYVGQSFGILLFFVAQFLGLVMVPLGLPGIWFQAGTAALLTMSTNHVGWWWTLGIALVAAIAETLDWVLGDLGFSAVGASKPAAWGALLCGFFFGFFGMLIPIPIPVLGSLIGAMIMSFIGTFVGAVGGEMIHEKKIHPKLHVALGAVVGRACGISAKLAFAFIAAGVGILALLLELAAVFRK